MFRIISEKIIIFKSCLMLLLLLLLFALALGLSQSGLHASRWLNFRIESIGLLHRFDCINVVG